MNSSNFRFTLDLHSIQSQYSIPVLVGDTGVTLHISITDGGVPYIINDGCLAKLSIMRPTGTHLEEFCTIRNNAIIEYPFRQNENTCAVEGIHHCDVTLYGPNGEKVGGPRFTMVVSERVIRSDDIVVTDEDRTIVDAMMEKEASRQFAESTRVVAEAIRVTAEEQRVSAEAERIAAEEERLRIGQIAFESAERAALSEANARNSENVASASAEIVREMVGNAEYIDSRINRNDKRITNLEQGIPSELFETDSSVAHIKAVPTNALPFAEITKLGGMTRKCANLLPANATDVFTTTANGANNSLSLYDHFYLNSGSVTISFNITKGANNTRNFPRLRTTDGSEQLYFGGGENQNVNAGRYSYTVTVTVSGYYDLLWWDNGNTVQQTISEIMLNQGKTALPFEAYYEGIKSAKVTELKSIGKNLLNYNLGAKSTTHRGITFTNNGDGSITINGTHDNSENLPAVYYFHQAKVNPIYLKEGITYTLSGGKKGEVGLCVVDENGKIYASIYETFYPINITNQNLPHGFYLYVNPNSTIDNVTVYPQLEVGTTATEFKAYSGIIDTLPIAEEIQELDGYGESNPNNAEEHNYIDFERLIFVAYGHIVDGSWVAFGAVQETDISHLITADNFIEVEGGGTVTFMNEYGFDVPSEITYQLPNGGSVVTVSDYDGGVEVI